MLPGAAGHDGVVRQQKLPFFLSLSGFFAVIDFRELNAGSVGQGLQGFLKTVVFIFHQEAVDISALSAAKAVKDLLGLGYGERPRLLLVERAKSHVVGALLLKVDVLSHHIHNVIAGPDFFYYFIRISQFLFPNV